MQAPEVILRATASASIFMCYYFIIFYLFLLENLFK